MLFRNPVGNGRDNEPGESFSWAQTELSRTGPLPVKLRWLTAAEDILSRRRDLLLDVARFDIDR